jgi:FlaA1/EpsC-like NDP-sugar epimerase
MIKVLVADDHPVVREGLRRILSENRDFNLVAEANAVFEVVTLGPEDALLGILPMFHVLAQMANLLLPLTTGARVVYLETLNTTELLRALQERDITAFAVVPQLFYLIHEKIFKELNKRGRFTISLVRILMAFNRGLRRVGINAGKIFFGKIHATFGRRMRYLVTGGAGFIGSHLADLLTDRGDEVTALDDISTGSPDNVAHLVNNPAFQLVLGSVMDASLVERLTSDHDIVVHLAAAVGVRLIVARPLESLLTNIRGTVLQAPAES